METPSCGTLHVSSTDASLQNEADQSARPLGARNDQFAEREEG